MWCRYNEGGIKLKAIVLMAGVLFVVAGLASTPSFAWADELDNAVASVENQGAFSEGELGGQETSREGLPSPASDSEMVQLVSSSTLSVSSAQEVQAQSNSDLREQNLETELNPEPAAEASGPALAVQSSADTPLAAQAAPSGPADGEYAIRSDVAERSVLDVAGGSAASGANVQLYTYNGTKAQRWRIARDEASGLYTVTSLVSGKALDVSGAGTRQGTNVQVYNPNGTRAQLWRLVADGSAWRFESALRAGVVLDISGGSSADGANALIKSI